MQFRITMAIKPRTRVSKERERRRREKRVNEYRADTEEEERLWLKEVHDDCPLSRINKREMKRILRSGEDKAEWSLSEMAKREIEVNVRNRMKKRNLARKMGFRIWLNSQSELYKNWLARKGDLYKGIFEQDYPWDESAFECMIWATSQNLVFGDMLEDLYPWDKSGPYSYNLAHKLNRGMRRARMERRERMMKERRSALHSKYRDNINEILRKRREERREEEKEWIKAGKDMGELAKRVAEISYHEKVIEDVRDIFWPNDLKQ